MSIVGTVWGQLSEAQQAGVLEDAGREGSQRFELYFKTILEAAAGKRKPPWRQRIPQYRARPDPIWEAMKREFPKQWQEQQSDWMRMEQEHGAEVPRVQPTPAVVQPAPSAQGPAWSPVVQDALQTAQQKALTRQIEGEYKAAPTGG